MIKKRRITFAQLRSNFSALADNVKKIHRNGKLPEIPSLLVSYLSNHLCVKTTELSEETLKDMFQRAMKDNFPSPTTKTDTEHSAQTFDLDEIESELNCAQIADQSEP